MTRFYTIKREKGFELVCHSEPCPAADRNLPPDDGTGNTDFRHPGDMLADFLMEQVDELRWHNNARALDYAAAILNLGCGLARKRIEALGYMAIGDTLAIEGCHLQTAWSLQQKSAELFKSEQDTFGWARTTIGRTGICVELNQCSRTLQEARQALQYFHENAHYEFYLRLCKNLTKVYNQLGNYRATIRLFNKARTAAKDDAGLWNRHMGILTNNAGLAFLYLGLYHQAGRYFETALANFIGLQKHTAVLYVRENIAFVQQMLGNYRTALQHYHEITAADEDRNSIYDYRIRLDLADCYLALNLDKKAKSMAQNLLRIYSGRDLNNLYDLAGTLRCLGYAEAKLGNWNEAEKQLLRAGRIFGTIKAAAWSNQIRLLRARILLQTGRHHRALHLIRKAADFFKINHFFMDLQEARLIAAWCLYKLGETAKARKISRKILDKIQPRHFPRLYYETNLLAGRISEDLATSAEAEKHYYAAFRCLEEWQRNLTITIKTHFMEDKSEAFHRLMQLLLKQNDLCSIISLMERFRWCSLLGYMTHRKQLYWSGDDVISRNWLDQLKILREEHSLFFKMSYERHRVTDHTLLMDEAAARKKLFTCEDKIRQLTEQLYLRSESADIFASDDVTLITRVREVLPENATLLIYYCYGNRIWLIIVKQNDMRLEALEISVSVLNGLLMRLYFNIQCQLNMGSSGNRRIVPVFEQISFRLYSLLLEPCRSFTGDSGQLFIVPFGLLSYLPFNCLYNGKKYLIEDHEIAVIPSVSLLLRKQPAYRQGGTVLAYSKQGTYPGTRAEAAGIAGLFACNLFEEEEATRDKLTGPGGRQFLHIAAHGMHRPDKPDFSFIELKDGQLFADDLIQLDLNYGLVTMSGCETGRLAVNQSGEMSGLVRGALLAGAGSLVASFWLVDDHITAHLMQVFYRQIKQGKSRARALAAAQRQLLIDPAGYSPAQWGAFQLTGDSGSLI